MAINQNLKFHRGISIIEILIVVAIIVIALTSLLGVATFSLKISILMKETNQANNLAQETIEAVRNFRDGTDWNTNGLGVLTTGISYYPKKSTDNPPKWQLVQEEETIDKFIRKVVFNNAMRDADDSIVATGGTNDPNTRKVTAIVSWEEKKVEIVTYLTNWK
jgi:type II secretory pathway pseudopilin PulG